MFSRLTKSFEASAQPIAGIRSSVLRVVVDAMDEGGLPTDRFLAARKLNRASLDDAYNVVSLSNYVAFFEDASVALEQNTMGLRLGEAIKPEQIGPVGVLFVMVDSLRTAIERLSRFFPALQGSTKLGLSEKGDEAWFEYQIEDPAIWPRRQDSEFTLTLVCALARSRLGQHWRPEEVHFEHSAPKSHKELSRFFGAVVRFEQPLNRMLITTNDLDIPLLSANQAAVSIIEQHLFDLIGDGQKVALKDAVALEISRCMRQGAVSLDQVAARLGCGSRTLQRRLAAEGIIFRDVVKEKRLEAAKAMLSKERLSLNSIAGSLGYADAAVMSRAFKSWTSTTPRAYSKKVETKSGCGDCAVVAATVDL
ncbi:hypothetical protein A6U97_25655 [Agrobacterium tumefaciens]|uniref:AraC-like transcriptional regulator QhpR n=1 Tax=Agrobacterium tumefaciens TaxID=358 RepID=UPI00080F7D0B|nr:hypothetical protein A6U97_25655 [Agrobacterium tumefaciens]